MVRRFAGHRALDAPTQGLLQLVDPGRRRRSAEVLRDALAASGQRLVQRGLPSRVLARGVAQRLLLRQRWRGREQQQLRLARQLWRWPLVD